MSIVEQVIEIIELGGVGPPGPARATYTVASQAAMLALAASVGDWAVRTDLDPDGYFELRANPPSVLGNWVQLPLGVISVDGASGAVVTPADGAAGVATRRTLGMGATQAAQGSALQGEIARAISAEAALASDIASEATARAAGDAAEQARAIAAEAALDAAKQPLDPDLTAIAATTTTAYGRSLLGLADGADLAGEIPSGTFAQPVLVSLRDFAQGDGSDESVEIQQALDYAATIPGARVWVDGGEYVGQNIRPAVGICGVGTLKLPTNANRPLLVLETDDVEIADVTIDGNRAGNASQPLLNNQTGAMAIAGIMQAGGDRCTVRNVTFRNLRHAGVAAAVAVGWEPNINGVVYPGMGENFRVLGCTFVDGDTVAIEVSGPYPAAGQNDLGAEGFVVSGCTFSNLRSTYQGGEFGGGCYVSWLRSASITDNTFVEVGRSGLKIGNVQRLVVAGNRLRRVDWSGIQVVPGMVSTTPVDWVDSVNVIRDNVMIECGLVTAPAILCEGGTAVPGSITGDWSMDLLEVAGNTIVNSPPASSPNPTGDAILIDSDARWVRIRVLRNVIARPRRHGINVLVPPDSVDGAGTLRQLEIAENQIDTTGFAVTGACVSISETGAIAAGNRVADLIVRANQFRGQSHGVLVSGDPASTLQVMANTFRSHSSFPVSWTTTVTGVSAWVNDNDFVGSSGFVVWLPNVSGVGWGRGNRLSSGAQPSTFGSELSYSAAAVDVPQGSAASPGLRRIDDTDTGVYFPAANAVGISAGAVGRVRVDTKLSVFGDGSTPAASADPSGIQVAWWMNATAAVRGMASTAASALSRVIFIGARSRGTPAAPTAVVNGDYTASFRGEGYDGATGQATAEVQMLVDGTVSAGNVPQSVLVATSPTGTASLVERTRVTSGGVLTVGGGAPGSGAATGDVELLLAGKGLILKSPDGSVRRRISIDNAGALVVSAP